MLRKAEVQNACLNLEGLNPTCCGWKARTGSMLQPATKVDVHHFLRLPAQFVAFVSAYFDMKRVFF